MLDIAKLNCIIDRRSNHKAYHDGSQKNNDG
jgi:hypothetical protein